MTFTPAIQSQRMDLEVSSYCPPDLRPGLTIRFPLVDKKYQYFILNNQYMLSGALIRHEVCNDCGLTNLLSLKHLLHQCYFIRSHRTELKHFSDICQK